MDAGSSRQAMLGIVAKILEAAELRPELAPTILAEITDSPSAYRSAAHLAAQPRRSRGDGVP